MKNSIKNIIKNNKILEILAILEYNHRHKKGEDIINESNRNKK